MPRIVEIQLHQSTWADGQNTPRYFAIRKITGAIAADLNGRRFFVGDTLNEKQADALASVRNYKVSVMADKQ